MSIEKQRALLRIEDLYEDGFISKATRDRAIRNADYKNYERANPTGAVEPPPTGAVEPPPTGAAAAPPIAAVSETTRAVRPYATLRQYEKSKPRYRIQTEFESNLDRDIFMMTPAPDPSKKPLRENIETFLKEDLGLKGNQAKVSTHKAELNARLKDLYSEHKRLGLSGPLRVPASSLAKAQPVARPPREAVQATSPVGARARVPDEMPFSTDKNFDLPEDVTGGVPPTDVITDGVTVPDEPNVWGSTREVGEQYAASFPDDIHQKVGQAPGVRQLLGILNPTLMATTIGRKLASVLHALNTEGALKADKRMQKIVALGSTEELFGPISKNVYAESSGRRQIVQRGGVWWNEPSPDVPAGLFEGFTPEDGWRGLSLNEIAERINTPYMLGILKEGTEEGNRRIDYIRQLRELDIAATKKAKAAGKVIGEMRETDDQLYATIKVFGKIKKDPSTGKNEIVSIRGWDEPGITVNPETGDISIAAKNVREPHFGAAMTRVSAGAKELTDLGYVLLPYDQAVRLKGEAAFRLENTAKIVNYIKAMPETEWIPEAEAVAAGRRINSKLFRDAAPKDEYTKEVIQELEEAIASAQRAAPDNVVARGANALNLVGRTYELAFDASWAGIQLIAVIFRELSPIRLDRSLLESSRGLGLGPVRLDPLAPLKIVPPLTTQLPKTKGAAFAKQFWRGVFDPGAARKANAELISNAENQGVMQEMRHTILFSNEKTPEFTEGVGQFKSIIEYFAGKGSVGRATAKGISAATRPIEAAQEAFTMVMNMSAIHLYKANRHLFKNMDRSSPDFGKIDALRQQRVEDWINNVRGVTDRGKLGVSPRQRFWESLILLAPRYRAATLAWIMSVFRGDVGGALARDSIGSGLMGLSLAFAAGIIGKELAQGSSPERIQKVLEDTFNPASNSFFLTNVHGQMVGFGSKLISDSRLLAKIYTRPEDSVETIRRWLRGQSSFATGHSIDILTGRDFMGNIASPAADDFTVGFKEGSLGLAENLSSLFIPIWLQSVAIEGGSASQRGVRGTTEFFGGRGFEIGRSRVLDNASWDTFEKPLDELNSLERFQLENVEGIGEELRRFDIDSAFRGDKYAKYREFRRSRDAFVNGESAELLERLFRNMEEISNKTKTLDDLRSILTDFKDEIGQAKATRSVQLEQYRKDHGLDNYTGDEPDNDFDVMLNEWYALFDKYSTKVMVNGEIESGSLDVDKWFDASNEFISQLTPELREQLQQWRNRKDSVAGVEELTALLGPQGVKEDGKPKFLYRGDLWDAIYIKLFTEGVTNYSAEQIKEIAKR